MSNKNRELFEFGSYRLDVAERLLLIDGERVSLPEKAFDTLCVLVRRGNHLVRKDELLNEVWPDAIVEENNLDKNISLLRQVLGERVGKGKFIETVRGHGFRFVPEVRQIDEEKQDVAEGLSTVPESVSTTSSGRTHILPKPGRRRPSVKHLFTDFRFLIFATAALLIVAGVAGVYFRRRSSAELKMKAIAVLPLNLWFRSKAMSRCNSEWQTL